MEPQKRIFAIDLGDLYLKFVFIEKGRAVLWGREELNLIFWQRPLEHLWDLIQNFFASFKGEEKGSLVLGFSQSFLKASFASHVIVRSSPQERISAAEEKTLEQEFQKELTEKSLGALSEMSGILKEEFLLERLVILSRAIDGYVVSRLEGLKGKEVVIVAFGVFLLRSHQEILDYIKNQYKLTPPVLVHEAETILQFAKDKNKEGLFLDIGDRISSVFLIQSGSLAALDVLPFGGDRFTSLLEQTLGMKTNVAREFKERFVKGQLTEDLRKRIHELFLPEARKLITLSKERLNKASFGMSFPCFLLGGGALIPELKEAFDEEGVHCSVLLPKDVLVLQGFPPEMNPQYTPLVLQLYNASAKTH